MLPERRMVSTPEIVNKKLPRSRLYHRKSLQSSKSYNTAISTTTAIDITPPKPAQDIRKSLDNLSPFSNPEGFRASYDVHKNFTVDTSYRAAVPTKQDEEVTVAIAKGGLVTFPLPEHLVESQ
jgi:hypothetical protein